MDDFWQNKIPTNSQAMFYMFKNNLCTDCTFLVGQGSNVEEVKAHKLVLCCVSPVFEVMFNGPLKPVDDVVKLPDIDPTSFSLFLDMIYTEKETFSPHMLDNLNVLYLATKYMVARIIKSSIKYILENVNFLHAANAYEYLLLLGYFKEADQCSEIIINETTLVLKSDLFTKIQKETLFMILDLDFLTLHSELELYNAAIRWIEAKLQDTADVIHDREALYSEVLSYVRFSNMTTEEFAQGPAHNPYIPIDERLEIYATLEPNRDLYPDIEMGKRVFMDPDDWKDNLLNAIKADDTERLSALKAWGSDLTMKYQDDWTLLHFAVYHWAEKTVSWLLHNGAVPINYRSSGKNLKHLAPAKSTALHLAALCRAHSIAQNLLKFGATPSIKDANGNTPRDIALVRNDIQMISILDDFRALLFR